MFWLGLNRDRKHLLEGLPRGFALRSNIRELEHYDKPPPKNLDFLGKYGAQTLLDLASMDPLVSEKTNFELRCHIFQARSLIGSDSTGLSDPFARVVFCGYSATTQVRPVFPAIETS